MSVISLPSMNSTVSSLPRWANVALAGAIGIALAVLTIQMLSANSDPLVPASPSVEPSSTPRSGPDALTLARGIAAHHIFGDVAAKPKPEPVQRVERIEETRTNLQLAGVFAANPQERAIAIISSGSAEQSAYGVGDKITGEITLKEVYPEYVIITNRGKDEKLGLPESSAPSAATSSIPAATATVQNNAGSQQQEDLSAPLELPSSPGELRDTLARNPSILNRVVSAEPYQENGKLLGYRITPKQNPEILEAQGIIAGDVITRVNNIQLNSQRQGIRALRNAVKADNLAVTVLRDGIEIPINISLAQ